jgi:SAM-dependent methyltransferase
MLEECSCNWCGETECELIFQGPDLLMGLPGLFSMVSCRQCGLVRQNPRLPWEALKPYYPEDYSAYEPIIETEKSSWRRIDRRYGMWKRLRAIEKIKSGGQMLDVGCGTGIFLAEAVRSGRWEVFGLEPNAVAVDYLRKNLNCTILNNQFSECKLPSGSFDVITLWNVLEHFDYPIRELRLAYNLLAKDGLLVFSIPNFECWEARLFGPYWLGWDLPRHLYLFPRVQLETILQELGFSIDRISCLAGSHAAFGLTLDFWSKSWPTPFDSLKNTFLKIYMSIPLRLALSFPFWVSDRMKRSGLITVFARKKGQSPMVPGQRPVTTHPV